jgi:hypothetical protein
MLASQDGLCYMELDRQRSKNVGNAGDDDDDDDCEFLSHIAQQLLSGLPT